MTATFRAVGPVEVPFFRDPGGKTIERDGLKAFWAKARCADDTGVYVFAVRTGRGALIPYYVGRTFRSFAKETFTNDKLLKYMRALNKEGHGTPVVFFLKELGVGAVNKAAIKALELEYINYGFAVNPSIENDRGIQNPVYEIESFGTRDASVRSLRRTFQL